MPPSRRLWYPFIAMVVAVSTLAAPALADDNDGDPVGAVYVATNEFNGNEILA